ncbi:MAG: hydantoinase/oxoprolinase N-terminal domain-containing protein, partial [Halobacteria archaeon]|nr:hydantoinase/oxoprolinase N-terminal domain-containing protein [Halobacteria archaeon]
MIIGVDAGGTNVDAVLVSRERGVVDTSKVPSSHTPESVRKALSNLVENHDPDDIDRVVVATTLVLNAAVQDRLPECTNIVIPGPGLNPRNAFHGDENIVAEGCVDHRGRVTEDVDCDEIPSKEVVSVTSKFSPRNPELELSLSDAFEYQDDRIALGHESGGRLGFPERAATTVSNAKSKPVFHDFEDGVRNALDDIGIEAPVYYLKGDAV